MADENQIKKFRENPDLFRLHLLNAFKECIGGIKELMRDTTLGNNGLPEHVEDTLIKSLNETLIEAFNKCNLETLMRRLNELEENASDKVAWRPTTGVVDFSGEKEYALHKRKKLLQAKSKQIDSEIEDMKQVITDKRNNLKMHLTELQTRLDEINNFDT